MKTFSLRISGTEFMEASFLVELFFHCMKKERCFESEKEETIGQVALSKGLQIGKGYWIKRAREPLDYSGGCEGEMGQVF